MRAFVWGFVVLEVCLLVLAGASVGVLWTLLWLAGSAVLGVFFIRRQALGVLLHPEQLLQEQPQDAARRLLDVPLLALGGLLLVLPGFVSDALGLLLLLPWLRRRLTARLGRRFGAPPVGDGVIEGEFVVVRRQDDDRPLPPPSA